MTNVSFPLAFLGGLVSFLSPCVLPLIPSYVSYITGISFDDLRQGSDKARIRRLTITNSIAFILGFSAVFILLGASSSYIGKLLFEYQKVISRVGGAIIIIFGLYVSGILKLGFLSREKKFHIQGRPAGYFGSFVIGVTFAAGWTPCIGPILGSILLYASTKGSTTYGLELLSVYSLGLAIPFFISSLAINTLLSLFGSIGKAVKVITLISGILLMVFGLLLVTDNLNIVLSIIPDLG